MSAQMMIPVGGSHEAVSFSGIDGSEERDGAKLRLTHRGRVVFGGLATVLVAALLAFVAALGAPQAVASDADGGQQFHYVVVQPGSSLWSLATDLDPSADPRDLVAEIVQLNQLGDSGVDAGQPLAVPLRYSENPGVVSADELGL